MKMERSVLSLLHEIICHFKNEKKSKVSHISPVEPLLVIYGFLSFVLSLLVRKVIVRCVLPQISSYFVRSFVTVKRFEKVSLYVGVIRVNLLNP